MEVPKTKEIMVERQDVVITDVNMENIKISPSKTYTIEPNHEKESISKVIDDASG